MSHENLILKYQDHPNAYTLIAVDICDQIRRGVDRETLLRYLMEDAEEYRIQTRRRFNPYAILSEILRLCPATERNVRRRLNEDDEDEWIDRGKKSN